MGTNYYWTPCPSCPHCGRPYEKVHIGKSSCGWVFALHVIPPDEVGNYAFLPEAGVMSLSDWWALWTRPGSKIADEYGRELTPKQMLSVITDRHEPAGNSKWSERDYQANHAVPGTGLAYGLARIHPDYCYGHGPGTWDLVTGEFS